LRTEYRGEYLDLRGRMQKIENEEPHTQYASPNITTGIKSTRMRWMGKVACKVAMKNSYKIWTENLKRRNQLENLGVRGRIILEWTLEK
jgi:hypothetical protein